MAKKKDAYTEAGVNISAADKAVELMEKHVTSTYTSKVLSKIGAFGGLIDVSELKQFKNPILVPTIDGGGTKTQVAEMMNQWTIGQCIVNHCVNDALTLGAKPLFFIDYVAAAKLKPEIMAKIVENMAIACRKIRIPLLCGETAEMPGIYQKGQHDVVGSILGIVEKDKIIDGSKIAEENVLIGLLSNGLHTNGYSLARGAFFTTKSYNTSTYLSKLSCTIGQELLKVHKCYFNAVYPLLEIPGIEIHGIAHITGGGFFENIGRLLPKKLRAVINYKWKIPPVFEYIQNIRNVSDEEMRRVFNLGIGMVLVVPPKRVKMIRNILRDYGERDNIVIGTIEKTRSKKKVVFTY